jgi:hypothetical protein
MVTPQKTINIETQDITSTSQSRSVLKNTWNLWAHLPQDSDWTNKSYKLIYKFKTLEDTIVITETTSDALIKGCMLFVMKDGIGPVWEDHRNRNGGCFSYKITNKSVCDVWRELNYLLVGESISNNSSFVSCVTGIKKKPKKNFCIIKIWMTNCEHQDAKIVTTDIKGMISHGCLFKKHTDNSDFNHL